MNVAFWVSADPAIGGGHVVRSLSIANALAAAGVSCTFFVNQEAISSAPLLTRSEHRIVVTPPSAAEAIIRAEKESKFDWLVVDNYHISAREETPWRNHVGKIAVIDDLANRPHDCDLLVDTAPLRQASDYSGLVPPRTELLIGPAFVPLRAEFAARRAAALQRREATQRPHRILVSFGLGDPGAITADAMNEIPAAFPDMLFDVVLGTKSGSYTKIAAMKLPRVTLHVDPPSMSRLMIDADIALGAGGSTAWERACLGLPAVVVILAENQLAFAHSFAAAGVAIAVERGPDIWVQVKDALSRLASQDSVWHEMSAKAVRFCDGNGVQRITQKMIKQ